ncbi:class I SAM-dependent methyltransferase [Mesorhizobium sp. CN2-181]|uniref:class I SAM-dependent methyltransferase n=1 Tax=Mesorhizobium yinganensis TaxID=3157707 RepID=UPI0032B75876
MTIDLAPYDFVDFGCSSGGSIKFAMERLGGVNGVGVDLDPVKVAATREKGFNAELADLTLPMSFKGKARFSLIAHVLEHIPSPKIAGQILRTAASISSEFVLVRQPWFDSDGPLAAMGVKLYWSDWSGHTNHMTTLEMYLALKPLFVKKLISSFTIFGYRRISHTASDRIVPLDGPINRHHYAAEIDGPKPEADLPFDCFDELVALIGVSPSYDAARLPPYFRDAKPILALPVPAAAAIAQTLRK